MIEMTNLAVSLTPVQSLGKKKKKIEVINHKGSPTSSLSISVMRHHFSDRPFTSLKYFGLLESNKELQNIFQLALFCLVPEE